MHHVKPTLSRSATDGAPALPMLGEVLELAELERPRWRPMGLDLRLSGTPLNDGEEEEDGLSKEEADKLKGAVAKKDKELRQAKKELSDQEDRITKLEEKLESGDGGGEEGKDAEARIAKVEKRLEEAEAKTERETEKREAAEQRTTAIEVATRLNFRNPKRAIGLLDSDDLSDEDSIESALEQLASEEPYLVASKKQRQVEEKPKPKREKQKPKSEEEKPKPSDDEPTGKARIKAAYDEAESEGEGEGGGEDGSED